MLVRGFGPLLIDMVRAWHGLGFAVRDQVVHVGALVLEPCEGAFSASF